jgi:ribosomal protein L20
VDHAYQRGCTHVRDVVQPSDEIDRKMLADLAVHDIEAFGNIVEQAKKALPAAQ